MAMKMFFMNHQRILTKKLMDFNQALKIGNCNIHGLEKRFMGLS